MLVENYFPTERGNRWLKVPFGSDKDRISHESCIFEIIQSRRCRSNARYAGNLVLTSSRSGNQGGTAEVLRLLSLFYNRDRSLFYLQEKENLT